MPDMQLEHRHSQDEAGKKILLTGSEVYVRLRSDCSFRKIVSPFVRLSPRSHLDFLGQVEPHVKRISALFIPIQTPTPYPNSVS